MKILKTPEEILRAFSFQKVYARKFSVDFANVTQRKAIRKAPQAARTFKVSEFG